MIKCPASDSSNKKLGKGVRATYREVGPTCPQDCQHLQSKSCYAMYAFVKIHADKSEYDKNDANIIYSYLTNLPLKKKIRHHVSGDFMKPGDEIDNDYIDAVLAGHKLRPDLQGWTYTHVWKRLDSEEMNSEKSLTVNASCDTEDDVRKALSEGWPATMVVDEGFEGGRIDETNVVVCPNQTHDLSCADCMLCFRKNRKAVVAFRVHGSGKTKFSQ